MTQVLERKPVAVEQRWGDENTAAMAADVFATIGDRANYIDQAPILLIGMVYTERQVPQVERSLVRRLLAPKAVLTRLAAAGGRGEKLRALFREYCIPWPLRKLPSDHLCSHHGVLIDRLRRVPASEIGNWITRTGGQGWLALYDAYSRFSLRPFEPCARWEYGSDRIDGFIRWMLREVPARPLDDFDICLFDLIDFMAAEGFDPSWSWNVAVRRCADWHAENARAEALSATEDPWAGKIAPIPDGFEAVTITGELTYTMLRTSAALAGEGRAMRHCVGSYAPMVLRGQCLIFSVTKAGKRVATVELEPAVEAGDWSVVQIRGVCNSAPPATLRLSIHAHFQTVRQTMRVVRGPA